MNVQTPCAAARPNLNLPWLKFPRPAAATSPSHEARASTLADAVPRQRGRSIPRSTYGTYLQYPTITAPVTAGDGYSADPHTRYFEMLADKYRPGW